jgi:hypothetical protein
MGPSLYHNNYFAGKLFLLINPISNLNFFTNQIMKNLIGLIRNLKTDSIKIFLTATFDFFS